MEKGQKIPSTGVNLQKMAENEIRSSYCKGLVKVQTSTSLKYELSGSLAKLFFLMNLYYKRTAMKN